MKKILCCSLIIVLVFSMTACTDIPVFQEYGIRFNMSPEDVISRIGEPVEYDLDDSLTPSTHYTFETPVLNQPAVVFCRFYRDKSLHEFRIRWEPETQKQADELAAEAEQLIREAYQDHKDFFRTQEENGVSIGIDDGAAGDFYWIRYEDNQLIVHGIALY